MFVSRNDNKRFRDYALPATKVRNIFCVHCKHRFNIEEFVPLRGLIPLLLDCGHIICDKCVKNNTNKPCAFCNVTLKCQDAKKTKLPVNMYMLGLMIVSCNRPIDSDDLDISFSQSFNSKLKQQCIQGLCHECGIQATIKCPQCDALYCNICYAKIHRRALQSHSKILLSEESNENSYIVRNTCSEMCSEPLGYYCENCQLAGCSHCMLRSHKQHNYLTLVDKNEKLLPQFQTVNGQLTENLQRIHQAQKKLKSIEGCATKSQNTESIEGTVTQHFTYLHGVLQNMEREIMDSLREYRNSRSRNLKEISAQLKEMEDQLHSAFVVTSAVGENLDKVDLQQVINKLQKLADIPCHLVLNSVADVQQIAFNMDESIVDAIREHCNIQMPGVSSYSLQRKDSLPANYKIEPLTEQLSIPNSKKSATRSTSLVSLSSQKSEYYPTVGTSETVHVTHVVDPSCFYVQLIQNKTKIAELGKGLKMLASISGIIPKEIILNALYVVQSAKDGFWYRGRVINRKTNSNGLEKYTVLFIDYGVKEENVPLTRMRTIVPQFAKQPIMALRCTLYDVVPNDGKWHPDAIEAFTKLVCTNVMITMTIMMITGDTYYVDLCAISAKDSGLISVKDSLTYMKYATCVSPNRLMRLNPDSTKKYYKEQLDMEAYIDVQVLFVESPSSVYVQKMHGNRTYFAKMIRDMTDEFEQNPSTGIFNCSPTKDLPVAARGVDGYWHRGIIDEITENTIKVFYVDKGYTLILSYDAVRVLPTKYMSCRTQAIKVSLRNIRPIQAHGNQWHSETTEYLKDLVKNTKQFRVIAFDKFDDLYSVIMYTYDKNNVSYLLVQKGLALNVASSTKKYKKKKKIAQKSVHAVEEREVPDTPESEPYEINTTVKSTLEENEDPFKVSVLVHQVESPDCIYVSEATCEQSDIEQMMNQMQEFYTKYRSAKREIWNKDAVCAVYSLRNERYYRGKIVSIKSTEKIVVHLYDLGIEETVPMSSLQPLYPSFCTVPTYVFKIKLTGILPCGGSTTWPSLSCDELREIINNNPSSKFYISKLEQEDIEDSTIPVELWVKQIKMDGPLTPTRIEINSINRMLVEKGVALPIKEYAKKRDKILAIELKRQLMKKLERLSKSELNVKWLKINNDSDSSINKSMSKELTKTLDEHSSDSTIENDDSFEEIFDNIPTLPKLSDWLPANPITENSFIAIPTYLDHDGFLYLHSKLRSKGTLQYIEKKLNKLYKDTTIEICDTAWVAGDLCIAQYHGNKNWYRGKITEVLENDMINVKFIDYGNVEECSIGTLKKKVALENIPIQCTKCLIDGLNSAHESGKWMIEDLDKMHSLLIEQECRVTILNRTESHLVISVTLLPNNQRKTKMDLITFLVNELGINIKPNLENNVSEESQSTTDTADVIMEDAKLLCTYKKSIDDHIISSGCSVLVQNNDAINETESYATTDLENLSWCKVEHEVISSTPYVLSEENLSMNYKLIDIPQDIEYIELELCCSLTATTFYAQLKENEHSAILNTCHMQYELLMKELQNKASRQPTITNVVPNTPCCAKFNDNLWYRCLIVETEHCVADMNNVELKLFYVDYGNDEYRTVNTQKPELHTLKKEWMDLPAMAIRCKLWNVEVAPAVEEYTLLSTELQKLYNKRVIATIKETDEEYLNIELYESKKCEKLMYSTLIEDGILQIKSNID